MEIKLICQTCFVEYHKPKWFLDMQNIFFRDSITYCDVCRRKKHNNLLKHLPDVINILANKK